MAYENTALNVDIDSCRLNSHEDLNVLRHQIIDKIDPARLEIVVCHGTGCMANGSILVTETLKTVLSSSGIDAKVMPGIKQKI